MLLKLGGDLCCEHVKARCMACCESASRCLHDIVPTAICVYVKHVFHFLWALYEVV